MSIYTEYTTGTGAIAIEAKGCHPADNIGITDEVRAARVTEAGAAGGMVVGQQKGEIAYNASIDLVQFGMGYHSNLLGLDMYWIDLLKSITDCSKRHVLQAALCL